MSKTSNRKRAENLKAGTIKLCRDCRNLIRHNIGGRCVACDEKHSQRDMRIKEADAEYVLMLRKHMGFPWKEEE